MPLFNRGPVKPKKPERPRQPPKPKRRDMVLVRTYHADGLGADKKAAKMFQEEARRLAKDGYVPAQTAAQGAKPASMLLGGLGLLKGGSLTVTYVLSPEAKAADDAATVAYESFKREEKRLMDEWRQAVKAWDDDCRRIDSAHAQHKAQPAQSGPMWNAAPPAPTQGQGEPAPASLLDMPVARAESDRLKPVSDIVDRLKALTELREAGIVSELEYEGKRQELLARL